MFSLVRGLMLSGRVNGCGALCDVSGTSIKIEIVFLHTTVKRLGLLSWRYATEMETAESKYRLIRYTSFQTLLNYVDTLEGPGQGVHKVLLKIT